MLIITKNLIERLKKGLQEEIYKSYPIEREEAIKKIETELFRSRKEKKEFLQEKLKHYGEEIAIKDKAKLLKTADWYESLLKDKFGPFKEGDILDEITIQSKIHSLKQLDELYRDFYIFLNELTNVLKKANPGLSYELINIERRLADIQSKHNELHLDQALIERGEMSDYVDINIKIQRYIINIKKVLKKKNKKNEPSSFKFPCSELYHYSSRIKTHIEYVEDEIIKKEKREVYLYFSQKEINKLHQIALTHGLIQYITDELNKTQLQDISLKDYRDTNDEDSSNEEKYVIWNGDIKILYKIFNELWEQETNFNKKMLLNVSKEDIDYFITTNFKNYKGNPISPKFNHNSNLKTDPRLQWNAKQNVLANLFYQMKTLKIPGKEKTWLDDSYGYLPYLLNKNFKTRDLKANNRGGKSIRSFRIETMKKYFDRIDTMKKYFDDHSDIVTSTNKIKLSVEKYLE